MIVAVTTDMVVDGDLDELGLYVGVAGEVKTSLRTPTSSGAPAKLPGTLSILQPSDASTPVHVRVAGYKNGTLKVVRDAITTVPSGQLSLLRVPLSWLASTHKPASAGPTTQTAGSPGNVRIRAVPGDNSFSEFDSFFPGYASPCAQGQTSADGECVDATAILQKISSGDLVREVYGGALGVDANGVAEGGTCFDVDACFANEQTLKEADRQGCKVALPAGLSSSKTVNFAIVREKESGCTGRGCFVPLDWDGKYDEASATFTFPPQVCKRIDVGDKTIASTRIAVATNCDAKMASRPRCNGLFGAVRDKAPSDPNRAPYYSSGLELPDSGPTPLDGSVPDASPPPPAPPVLLATLTQLQAPRKLAIANDRVWVRGRIGLAFLDARGPSSATETSPLPTITAVADNGNGPSDIEAVGNSACAGTSGPGAKLWCYTLTSRDIVASETIAKQLVIDGKLSPVKGAFVPSPNTAGPITYHVGAVSLYPNGTAAEARMSVPPGGAVFGATMLSDGRGAFATAATFGTTGEIRVSSGPLVHGTSVASSVLAQLPATATAIVGNDAPTVVLTANSTELFFTVGNATGTSATLARRALSQAAATEATAMTTPPLPYTIGELVPTLAADANYVYWGGGASGPMAISTCTTRAVAPKALFPTAGAQDNTTYAVARSGTKLYFATNDGRVYSMAPPAAEACP